MFRFKEFSIEQDRTPMKVGTDGVLLGAWVSIEEGVRHASDCIPILDIGTGSGLIALMMAQRCSAALVDGVEIDEGSASQAADNVRMSSWGDRVSIHHTPLQSFRPDRKYDLIVSNPPYFVDSLLSPDKGRSVARHTTSLPFSDLIEGVVRLMSREGRFALILPTAESQLFDREARGRLSLVRRCEVVSREGGGVKRIMSEYRLGAESSSVECEGLVIESGRPPQFTEEYRALTRDFYLKF